jgi:hypothetical protein
MLNLRHRAFLSTIRRSLLLAAISLGVYFLPGVDGFIPVPCPAIVALPQQARTFRANRASWHYPNSDPARCPVLPVLPELLVACFVALLWSHIQPGHSSVGGGIGAWSASSVLSAPFRWVVLDSHAVHGSIRTDLFWPFGAVLLGVACTLVVGAARARAAV